MRGIPVYERIHGQSNRKKQSRQGHNHINEKGVEEMKILKKPKIKQVICKTCGCVYRPSLRNLKEDCFGNRRRIVICPYCQTGVCAEFDKDET